MLLLTLPRQELLYVRDEIAEINQYLQVKDAIDLAASTVLMDPHMQQRWIVDI